MPPVNRRTFLQSTGVAAASATVGTGAAGADAGNRFLTDDDELNEVAHRGYAGRYPENTVAAVSEAARIEATDLIEIDVMPCAEGTVVVFHDDDLDRKTDQSGLVYETDCETVTSAEVLRSGQTIPTLAQVLDAVPPSVTLNIEFKRPGIDRDSVTADGNRWVDFTERVVGLLRQRERTDDVIVSSFAPDALAACRAVAPNIPLAYLFADDSPQWRVVAEEYDVEAIHPSDSAVDQEMICTAHEQGRAVNVYTLTTWGRVEELRAMGADGVITDHPLTGFGAEHDTSHTGGC